MRFNPIQKLFGRTQWTALRPSPRRQLRLEVLEDRWVPSTLTVGRGQQYATIGAALTAANPNDTIAVLPGTYNEQLTIAKSGIKLAALRTSTSYNVIITDPGVSTVSDIGGALIDITASNVTVTGFQINGTSNDPNLFADVRVRNGGSATISGNMVLGPTDPSNADFGIGIQVGTSRDGGSGATVTVTSNTINNYVGAGILVDGSQASAIIASNTITGRGSANQGVPEYGVQVSRGAMGNVANNTISGNSNGSNSGGIYFVQDGGVNSTAKANTVSGNDIGIWLDTSSATANGTIHILGNIATGNTGFAGILDQYSNGVLIQSNSVLNNNTSNGIALAFASNVQVISNTVTGNASDGIYDFQGTSNQIAGNTSSHNNGNGIFLEQTTGDTVSSNTLQNNTGAGLYLLLCSDITISGNTFANNTGGNIVYG